METSHVADFSANLSPWIMHRPSNQEPNTLSNRGKRRERKGIRKEEKRKLF